MAKMPPQFLKKGADAKSGAKCAICGGAHATADHAKMAGASGGGSPFGRGQAKKKGSSKK